MLFLSSDILLGDEIIKTKTDKMSEKAGVALTFDDHSIANWCNFLPTFKKYNAHVTFFIDQWDKLSPTQIEGLKKLRAAGHAIGCHSLRHRPAVAYCKEHHGIKEYLAAEITPALAAMKVDGFEPTCFAYPCSSHDKTTDDALLEIFRHLRSGCGKGEKSFSQLDAIFTPVNKIKTTGCFIGTCLQPHGANDPLITDATGAFKRAKKQNEIIVFYAHDIRPDKTPGPSNYITPDALELILKNASDAGLKFYTFNDF